MSLTDRPTPNTLAQRSYRWVLLLFALWTLLGGSGRAWAFDPPAENAASQDRPQAAAALSTAQDDVQHAKAVAKEARARLDAFLSKHFEMPRHAEVASPPNLPPPATELANPELTRLQSQLEELQAERERLLSTLTEAHPEVVDADGKIAALKARLAKLGTAGEPESEPVDEGFDGKRDRDWAERQKRQSEDDAAEYQRLFDDWEAAEQALDAARTAESLAAEHLAAIPLHLPAKPRASHPSQANIEQRPARNDGAVESKLTSQRIDLPASAPPASTTSSGTQTLALASLAIALAIAALAAVRLARSSADPLFSSADEAAAALAIPVVGIVPAAASGAARAIVPARKGLRLLVQLLLALLVFCVVAYSIKNADEIWRFFADPVPGLRSFFGL